ncbi:MAG TPA: TonB-dependent receptor, partial [Bacteroidia bacterium]|nr:TonB-dependent receptor [Bacteroidia bacterium]
MRVCFFLLFFFAGISVFSQNVTLSGIVRDSSTQVVLPYVNVVLKAQKDSAFVTGSITNEEGVFQLTEVKPGEYFLEIVYVGYKKTSLPVIAGTLSPFLDLGHIDLSEDASALNEVVIAEKQDAAGGKMDKKTFTVEDNISQSGGTVLDVLKTLPGITISADGKVQLRGNDRVVILVDGKQTALTGFGDQTGLDNIPASAVERIEIINSPSSKYDANGNAGIINIILKKEKKEGFNGKAGLATGIGALWVKKENLPGIRPQYQNTPKINPSLSLNYRKNRINLFLQSDYLYTQTLNKNEFVERTYDTGDTIMQQLKRNRNTSVFTAKTGIDYFPDEHNSFTFSTLFSSEKIIDRGDEPFFNADLSERYRLWQFLEDELKTTVTASVAWQHTFKQPGRVLNVGFNYTFHREDEKYFFTNIMPAYTGYDSFKLLSDEHVGDFTADYVRPLRYGRFESGMKIRKRFIPTDMQFFPGLNSPLDTNAAGWANYNELIPALYGNYVFENKKLEVEAGLRVEYVRLDYIVNPEHST